MFGKNEILKTVHRFTGTLDVHSIFYTLQGEGPFAGVPAVFVRLHGCTLACSWCDTEFEQSKLTLEPSDLVQEATKHIASANLRTDRPPALIVLTGGEPLRQNVVPAVHAFNDAGYAVQIETAGIHFPTGLDRCIETGACAIVCSPKTARIHSSVEDYAEAYKYILDRNESWDLDDGLPSFAVSQRGQPPTARLYRPEVGTEAEIFVSPLDPPNRESSDYARNWQMNQEHAAQIAMRYGYRLSLQVHKIVRLP